MEGLGPLAWRGWAHWAYWDLWAHWETRGKPRDGSAPAQNHPQPAAAGP